MKPKLFYHLSLSFAAFALSVAVSQGAILVYEGFDYASVGDELIGKGGTTEIGLSGTWADAAATGGTANDMFLKSGSLAFSDLNTSGNHIGFSSNANSDIYNRSLTTTGFTGTIYFSFLFEKLQNNFGADHEGFALMNQVLGAARWDSGNAGATGLDGFAVAAVSGGNLQAVLYDGATGTRVVSGSSIPISVGTGQVNLVVGEISFNTGTGGADVFRLYNAIDDGALDTGDLTLIDTIEANMNESSLNTLNLTRQVNVNYDEIRIGTTLDDVLGIPEPSTIGLLALSGLVLLRRRY